MKKRNPRHGSMQFWPRKRARSQNVRIRSWGQSSEAKLLGFAGYKVGMTHVGYTDNRKNSTTKGQEVASPVTIIECPPLKVLGARAYKKGLYETKVVAQSISPSKDVPFTQKSKDTPSIDSANEADYLTLLVYTQPKLTSIGKKKPEVFEVGIGGSVADQIAYAKNKWAKKLQYQIFLLQVQS